MHLFTTIIPALSGYYQKSDDTEDWTPVIAWGFNAQDNFPVPITAWGACNHSHYVKLPDGNIVWRDA